MLLSTCSHLRCSSAVPNFRGQEFRLQEKSFSGAYTLALQTWPCCLGNGKNPLCWCSGVVMTQKFNLNSNRSTSKCDSKYHNKICLNNYTRVHQRFTLIYNQFQSAGPVCWFPPHMNFTIVLSLSTLPPPGLWICWLGSASKAPGKVGCCLWCIGDVSQKHHMGVTATGQYSVVSINDIS